MSQNITIELRQKDSKSVIDNGEYEIILGNEIKIEDGDVLQVRDAFIDTLNESNISIPNDITLSIKTGLIFRDWYVGSPATKTYVDYFGGPAPAPLVTNYNCGRFMPYLKSVDSTTYHTVTGYKFNVNYSGTGQDAFNLYYTYIGTDDIVHSVTTVFPALEGPITELYLDAWDPVIAKVGSVTFSGYLPVGITTFGPNISPVPVEIDRYDPYEFTTYVLVPAGSYNPTELSIYISEKLALVNPTINTPENLYASNFIWSSFDFAAGQPVPGTNPFSIDPPPTLIPAEGTYFFPNTIYPTGYGFKFSNDASLLVGASQIALEYNETNSKFEFTFAHLPMYDAATGSNICIRYINNGEIQAAPDGGGIYFTGLSAKNNNDGSDFDFWSGIMGFDLDSMIVKPTNIALNAYGLTAQIQMITPFVDGVNTVTGYAGIDSLVVKGATSWFKNPVITLNSQDGLCSTISNTLSIRAAETVPQLLTKFSHYLISTDLVFSNNNYIGSSFNTRSFNAIVSKYYSYSSYTYGATDSAIQYQHTGSTQQIKSIKVRILKSDRKKDVNLLDDNTIILQLIKAPQKPITA